MSRIVLEKDIFIDIKIDGRDLPSLLSCMHQIEIIENADTALPVMLLILQDEDNALLDGLALSDANTVDLLLGTKSGNGDDLIHAKLRFNVFSNHMTAGGTGYLHHITGVLDAPKYLQESNIQSIEGTSADAIAEIASDCGLSAKIDVSASDKMVWLNPGITRSKFVEDIVSCAYATKTGLPKVAVTLGGELRFYDVNEKILSKGQHKLYFGDGKAKGNNILAVFDVKMDSAPGFSNSFVNYGYHVTEPMLDGKLLKSTGISIQTDGNFIPMNQKPYYDVETARINYAPHDCGNTHSKYWESYHSNIRKSAMYNQGVICLLHGQVSNIRVLDTVDMDFVKMSTGDSIDESKRSTYLVTGTKVLIRHVMYSEFIRLTKFSTNKQGSATLINTDGKGSPTRTEVGQEQAGKSDWTYITEGRKDKPEDGVDNIIDEELMPTETDSTEWDDPEKDWLDDNADPDNTGPYEQAHTEKRGQVKQREEDTDPGVVENDGPDPKKE